MVSQFRSAGNSRVYGLIDWDKENTANDGIVVLAITERYAIENVLLDPLLVVALLLRTMKPHAFQSTFQISEELTYLDFGSSDESYLQGLVNRLQSLVLPGGGEELKSVKYASGLTLNVSRQYLELNGKRLVSAVMETFPCLKRFKTGDAVMGEICDSVLRDYPRHCPQVIVCAFEALLADVEL
jgi:hypothetical protein